ncbi:histone H3.v1-like [Cottoperca gobio]|uniref:Histone H3.v1-like n=1 Tax=Cottoperca gobio TaxID=56716 RepID=A0A6J2Q7H1_COTGO|nr:histone H3.v1-like [Cottoperca gobio]
MKRKINRSAINSEEEEEEDLDRRCSPRIKKKVRYIDINDEDNEQPSTSNHSRRAQENRLLTVTCGNKTGILHREKLARDELCIESEERWFFPGEFEKFGGKASSKKWKQSIYLRNQPLQYWIEKGYLTIKTFERRTGTVKSRQKKILSPDRISESASEESEIQSVEQTEEDDVEEEEWDRGSETDEEEEERVGTENEEEVVDSGDEESKEEDEDMLALDDSNEEVFEGIVEEVFEERETPFISTSEESALKKVTCDIERLPKTSRYHQSNGKEYPLKANSAPNIKPKNLDKHFGSTSNRTANLSTSHAADRRSENTDASTSGQDAAQVMELDMTVPRASDSTLISTCLNPDTMDLTQLKREKVKMQLKVLKLQDEYYTLKIKELKK